MPLNFTEISTGELIGSTVLARNVLLGATKNVDEQLNEKIQQVNNAGQTQGMTQVASTNMSRGVFFPTGH